MYYFPLRGFLLLNFAKTTESYFAINFRDSTEETMDSKDVNFRENIVVILSPFIELDSTIKRTGK